jgi:hypothetical protein
VSGDAGANRARVTIALLRRLGLRDVLLRVDAGYLLDSAIPIVVDRD